MFPEFLDQTIRPNADPAPRHWTVTVRPDHTVAVLDDGSPWREGLAWNDWVVRAEHTIAEWMLRGFADRLPLHAGAASVDGGAALLLGPSGSGKSSVTTALLLKGCPIFGDDVVLLDATGRLEAFPRRPKLDAEQAVRLGLDPAATVLWHEGAEECWIDTSRFGGWSGPESVRALIRVQYVAGHEAELEPVQPAEMLTTLLASVVPRAGLPVDPELTGSLATLAAQTPRFDLRYGDAIEAAVTLSDRFSDPSAPT